MDKTKREDLEKAYRKEKDFGVAYGAIAKDGRQLFRTCELFNAPTFV